MLSAQDLDRMQQIAPFRSRKLFEEFLPIGYEITTLSSVETKDDVIKLKVTLGTLITLYDDYADRPDTFNPRLLKLLYRVPFENVNIHEAFLSTKEKESLSLAMTLFRKLFDGMKKLLNYDQLIDFFLFDLKQFFLANSYCELLMQQNKASNILENKLYLHHNMGIVMAGMIDLMSISTFKINELGQSREIFLLGQRAGRISNVLTTLEREIYEKDITNEILSYNHKNTQSSITDLELELADIINRLMNYKNIKCFSTAKYSIGIKKLHDLHQNLKIFI